MANASSDHHPNHVPGMLIIIKPKQQNLPICSATSINLLFHLFSKPSLHLIAKIILGIIMTAIIISPNIFNQSIYSSTNPNFLNSTNLNLSFLICHHNSNHRSQKNNRCESYKQEFKPMQYCSCHCQLRIIVIPIQIKTIRRCKCDKY